MKFTSRNWFKLFRDRLAVCQECFALQTLLSGTKSLAAVHAAGCPGCIHVYSLETRPYKVLMDTNTLSNDIEHSDNTQTKSRSIAYVSFQITSQQKLYTG